MPGLLRSQYASTGDYTASKNFKEAIKTRQFTVAAKTNWWVSTILSLVGFPATITFSA